MKARALESSPGGSARTAYPVFPVVFPTSSGRGSAWKPDSTARGGVGFRESSGEVFPVFSRFAFAGVYL